MRKAEVVGVRQVEVSMSVDNRAVTADTAGRFLGLVKTFMEDSDCEGVLV